MSSTKKAESARCAVVLWFGLWFTSIIHSVSRLALLLLGAFVWLGLVLVTPDHHGYDYN